jgi:hypothetical protein
MVTVWLLCMLVPSKTTPKAHRGHVPKLRRQIVVVRSPQTDIAKTNSWLGSHVNEIYIEANQYLPTNCITSIVEALTVIPNRRGSGCPLAPRRPVLPPVLQDYEHEMRAVFVKIKLVMDGEEVGGRRYWVVWVERAIFRD